MKNKFIYILLVLLVSTVACKKDYLNTDPSDQIQVDRVFEDIKNVQVALNGIYRMMYMQYADQEEDGQAAIMIMMDFMGEDIVHTASGTAYFRTVHQWSAHRSETSEMTLFPYRMYYRIIANVNLLLDGLHKVPNVTTQEIATVKGELLAVRAFSHFMLVQLYAKRYESNPSGSEDNPNVLLGVQIMNKYSEDAQPRATVAQVYKFINDDLDQAITDLQNAPARGTTKTHIDKNVAKGIKARVALTQQNWEDAVKYAAEARQGYSLMNNSSYLDGFNDMKNGEWMWAAHQLAEQLPAYGSFYSYMSANFNSAHTRPNPKLINIKLYENLTNTDVRKKLFSDNINDYVNFPGIINASTGQPEPSQVRKLLMHKKFVVADPAVSVGDIPFMRAAEMYLIEAEALMELGRDQEALIVLTPLAQNRDPLFDPTTFDLSNIADLIDTQRRIELWGEGFRFLDLKRKNQKMDRDATGATSGLAITVGVDPGDVKWQFKIPRREMQANPFMTQNP